MKTSQTQGDYVPSFQATPYKGNVSKIDPFTVDDLHLENPGPTKLPRKFLQGVPTSKKSWESKGTATPPRLLRPLIRQYFFRGRVGTAWVGGSL